MAALGAAKASQMRINIEIVGIIAAAFRTFACIGQIDRALSPHSLLEAVPDNFIRYIDCQGSRERVFRVENQNRFGASLDSGADLLQCVLYAPIAVDLITEQVGHNDCFGTDIGNDLF